MQKSTHRSHLRWTSYLAGLVTLFAVLSTGCNKKSSEPAATAAQSQPANQAPATTPMSLDDLVAPIALYPDKLLGQILIASTNSQEVLDLGNWLIQNQSLKPDQAPAAAKTAGFSTSAQYLAAFPQVVDNMCQEMDWTQQLGTAFKADQKGVMDAIQRKRAQAKQLGNLKSSPQMTVDTKQESGKEVIQIAPADPQVIYVPQYNTQTVYVTPAPAPETTTQPATTTEASSGVSTGAAVGIGLLSFGLGMAVGSAFHNDNYYPYPSWGYGGMYYGGRPYYPPPYRAPVYPGYRPAGAYHPPSNYRWNEYNRNVNVKVNNDKYYGRYHNTNVAGGGGNTAYLGARNNEVNSLNNNRNVNNNRPNAGGQSGYQGARPQANPNQKPGASMARANPENANRNNAPAARSNAANNAARPNVGNNAPNANANRPNAGNAGAGNLSSRTAAAGNRPANMPSAAAGGGRAPAGGGDRGFSSGGGAQPNRAAAAQNRSSNEGAFGGGNASGKSDRAASSRGHSSMGASGGGGGRRQK